MNLTLNSLPTRTWNHLQMNETKVDIEGELINHTPEAAWDPAEVRWDPKAAWLCPAAAHGLSQDLTAFTQAADTALVETEAGHAMERPIVLKYHYAAGERGISRLALHAAEGSTLSAVVLLTSEEDSGDTSALQIQIHAEKDAKVKLYVAQLLGRSSVCLHEVGGTCEASARVEIVRLELGAEKAYVNTDLDLLGRESSFRTEIGYHTRPWQTMDMNYVALHRGERTESLMEVAGTLEEGARKIFRGTIDFQRGARGAKGTENENVLLMGEEMVNQTIPLILCKEEDVEGNHGASIGQLDDKVLFYLGTRGIDREKAQRIIAEARIDAVCAQIPDESVRALVHQFENPEEAVHEEL